MATNQRKKKQQISTSFTSESGKLNDTTLGGEDDAGDESYKGPRSRPT